MSFSHLSHTYSTHGSVLPVPKYYQLKESLLERITNGTWQEGEAIPPEPELCSEFGVSRITVRRAISELVHEGKLYTIQGKGTFVAHPKLDERFVQRAFGFYEDMESQGVALTTQILRQELVSVPDAVAPHLDVALGTQVVVIERLRSVQGEKILVSTTYIPQVLCPHLVHDDLSHVSLYRWLQTCYGLSVARAERYLEAVSAGEREARLLNIAVESPVMQLESVVYLPSGKPLEYSITHHRGDRTRVRISFVPAQDDEP